VSTGYGLVRTTQIKYGNHCTLNGCNNRRQSGHRYCPHHKYILLYRGDAEQSKINLKDINFCRKTVELLIAENQSNPSWADLMDVIKERWESARLHVNSELIRYSNGKPMQKRYRNGLMICHGIFNTLGLEKAFITWCAWQYLQEFNPRLFVSDLSFRHQVVKSLRNQAHTFHSHDIDKTTGKPRVYSSPLYMTERDAVWEIMGMIFGATGLHLYKQLDKRAERLRKQKEKLYESCRRIE
jgi:hypothetical protein